MSLSKAFNLSIKCRTCSNIFHPDQSCVQLTISNLKNVIVPCATFFIPLVFIPLCRKLNNVEASDLYEALALYGSMTSTAYLASILTQINWCMLRSIFGQFHRSTIFFFPTFFGNIVVFLMSQRAASLFASTIWTSLFEASFRREDTWYWNLLKTSRIVRTLLFMSLSSVIMSSMQKKRSDIFWFLQPPMKKPASGVYIPGPSTYFDLVKSFKNNNHVCLHKESCDSYIMAGLKTYLKLGLGIEGVRILFGRIFEIKQSPLHLFSILARNVNTRFITFLVSYSTIYRVTNCYLNRDADQNTSKSNTMAAFLAGITYFIYPNFTILGHATVSAIRLLWNRYSNAIDDISVKLRFVRHSPLSQLAYMVGIALAFHIRVFYPHICPGLIFKATSLVSGFTFDKAALNFSEYLLGFQ